VVRRRRQRRRHLGRRPENGSAIRSFRPGKTYQRRHEGTGLGLSIVKKAWFALHGGEMNRAEQNR